MKRRKTLFKRKNTTAPITGELTENSLRTWLVQELATRTGVAVTEIDPSRTFDSYGLDSRAAVQVSGSLEKVVERRLSPAILFEHQSVDQLVSFLSKEIGMKENSR
ncbi:MAG: acyl carrier protein [Mycobacteriaceae bacterium]